MRSWLSFAVFSGMLMCAAAKNNDLTLRVSIPKDVAAQATQQLSNGGQAPAPVLVLQGLEFGANEGFKIEVLAESESNTSTPVVLAVTGVVGRPQSTPQPPLQKIDLSVPLNEKAAQFLAGKSEVTLTFRFERTGPGRPPVKIDRVVFQGAAN